MNRAEKLLNKEKVTGEDIGRLLIYNDIYMYKKQIGIECDDDCQIVTQDVFDELNDRIETIEDAEILECYVQLQHFVQSAQAMSYAYNQQAQNGFCRLLMYMTQAQQIEYARSMIDRLPFIMTERQFRERNSPSTAERRRGVAIVANDFPCRPKCLDSNDHFIEPSLDCFKDMMSLEHAYEMREKLEYFRNDLLLGGLKLQNAYNRLFELIAERIRIPEFTVFCTDTEEILVQIEDFNRKRAEFEETIAGYGREYRAKQRICSEVFRAIDLSTSRISEKASDEVGVLLRDISMFRTSLNRMITLLVDDGRK